MVFWLLKASIFSISMYVFGILLTPWEEPVANRRYIAGFIVTPYGLGLLFVFIILRL